VNSWAAGLSILVLALLAVSVPTAAGPATPNPIGPHLDTWNPKGIKGPNRVDTLIVRFPAGFATQRGGTCSVMVEASYSRERERSYSFLPGGQFLVNERFGRSPDRDSAVSGTRAFFLFPRPRWLTLESRATGGSVTVRLDPVRVVQIDSRGLISQMTGAVLVQEGVISGATEGGVTFKRFDGVVLDAGWGRGEVAFQKYPEAESTFTDRTGRACGVTNRDIFSYENRFRPALLFESDQELARFLTTRCGAEFDVASLQAGPRRADVSVHEPPPVYVPPPPRRPQPPP
jgi:hypothetical protein